MRIGHILLRYVPQQSLLHLPRTVCRSRYQPEPVADAIHVGVHSECRFTEPHRLHHVRRLAPHTGQTLQFLTLRWHHAAILTHYHASHIHQMPSLRVGIRHALHQLQHVVHLRCRHRPSIGKATEQFGGDHVYTFVRALRTQHRGHKQLESTAKLKFRSHIRPVLPEKAQHTVKTLSAIHSYFLNK